MNVARLFERENICFSAMAIGLLGGTYLVHQYFRNHTSDKTELLSEKILKVDVFANRLKSCNFTLQKKVLLYFDSCVYTEKSIENTQRMIEFPILNIGNMHNVSLNCRKLEITLKRDDHSEPIYLPETMNYNLLRFLQRGRFDANFCCFDFVNYLCGNFKKVNFVDKNDWTAEHYFDDTKLRPADVILLYSSYRNDAPSCWARGKIRALEKRHMAIYLGHGIYLSLFGVSGPVMLTSMQEMKKNYDTDKVLKLSPTFTLRETDE